MAKHFFYLAVGALALTACTQQDVVDDVIATRNVIKFENVVNKPSRAAKELTTPDLKQFNVYGFYTTPDNDKHAHEVFKDVPVTKNDGSWGYESKYTRYWVNGATYYFYAYSCGSVSALSESYGKFYLDMSNDNGGKLASDRDLKIDGYICDNTHQHDLIFASNTGIKGTDGINPTVGFTFNHVLSKIMASFTSKFSPEYDVVISNVKLENICNIGNYSFKGGADNSFNGGWMNVDRQEDKTPIVYLLNTTGDGFVGDDKPMNTDEAISVKNEIIDKKQASVDTKAAFVIPFNYNTANVYLKLDVKVMLDDDVIIPTQSLKATFAPSWAPGFSYIYNIEISPESLKMETIKFEVTTISGWEPGSSTTLKID